jgi:hypothetical protein
MSVFDEDKMIDDEFLKRMGFDPSPTRVKGYFSKMYHSRYRDWGKEPCTIISPLTAYYSRKHNNLYIQISCWDWRSKKHKVYNQDDFLRALYEHELIYYKVENESSSI